MGGGGGGEGGAAAEAGTESSTHAPIRLELIRMIGAWAQRAVVPAQDVTKIHCGKKYVTKMHCGKGAAYALEDDEARWAISAVKDAYLSRGV